MILFRLLPKGGRPDKFVRLPLFSYIPNNTCRQNSPPLFSAAIKYPGDPKIFVRKPIIAYRILYLFRVIIFANINNVMKGIHIYED
jgi:hypothetical protein